MLKENLMIVTEQTTVTRILPQSLMLFDKKVEDFILNTQIIYSLNGNWCSEVNHHTHYFSFGNRSLLRQVQQVLVETMNSV